MSSPFDASRTRSICEHSRSGYVLARANRALSVDNTTPTRLDAFVRDSVTPIFPVNRKRLSG